MDRPIDLPRVRRALQRLDELARNHPELRHGEPWADHLDTLEDLIMPPTPAKTRMASLRERKRAAGYREVSGLWLDPEASQALARLERTGGRQRSEILGEALKALERQERQTSRGQPPTGESADDAAWTAWKAFNAAYKRILGDERRGWSTTELISLLEPVANAFMGRTGRDDQSP